MAKIGVGDSVRTPEDNCRSCGKSLTGAFAVGDIDRKMPKAGDVSLCRYCGHIAVFGDDLKLREPNGEEIREIAGNPLILLMQRIRGQLAKEEAPDRRDQPTTEG